jgi:hypothetical protein
MHVNCTSEIPVTVNNTNLFVDPISFVIKAALHPSDATTSRLQGGSSGENGTVRFLRYETAESQDKFQ